MAWFTYILLCEDNSLYTGYTDNVERRFLAHQSGKGAKYTISHKPVRVIYSEAFASKSEALKREHEIKSWSRTKKINQLNLVF